MDATPLILSLEIALLATAFSIVIGIAAAWFVLRLRRAQALLDGILTLPMVLPPTVVGFALLLLMGKNGPVGALLNQLGISVIFTPAAAVVAATVVAIPLMYRTVRGAMEQLDPDLAAAGRTLGMSEWRIFVQVTLPGCMPGIAAGTVLSFARALGEFGATMMVAGNIPGKTQTMSIAIYSAVQAGKAHYDEALFWTAIICLMSFAGMLAVNLWNSIYVRRKGGKGR
ncbi:MAG: molybdate ABC transporter permease subunit [Eubacteriales bacterium]|nr:molybdate ABC transporter permease subunit [Eubacteriales bacterium]